MTKRTSTIIAVILAAILAAITVHFAGTILPDSKALPAQPEAGSASSSSQDKAKPDQSATPEPAARPVTITGTVGCLKWRDESKPHIDSCAIGLTTDDGVSYGMNASDPTVTGSIPTGQRVTVTGSLKEQQSDTYVSDGILNVDNVERLQ